MKIFPANSDLGAFSEAWENQPRLREIESFKSAKLKSGLSPKTVNNHLTILRRILSLAAEWEIISHTPPIK